MPHYRLAIPVDKRTRMVPVNARKEPEDAPIPDWVLEKFADAEKRGTVTRPLNVALVWDESPSSEGILRVWDATRVLAQALPLDIESLYDDAMGAW